MKRRNFIALIGGAGVWPLAARAQQPTLPVVGFLNSGSPRAFARLVAAFHRGLGDVGYVEYRNVRIEYRWAEGHAEQLPVLASELVGAQVAVICAFLWRRQPPRQPLRLFSRAARTRSNWAWWPATTDPAATLPASPC
jgi:hypothetical protein